MWQRIFLALPRATYLTFPALPQIIQFVVPDDMVAAAAANALIQIPMVDAPYNIELQVYSKLDCIDLAGDQSNETIICEETPSSFQPIQDAHPHTRPYGRIYLVRKSAPLWWMPELTT
jgi:hypothetical protein